ncbi:MAG: hypothetical protein ABSF70_20515 [Terracidiphilus sp.]
MYRNRRVHAGESVLRKVNHDDEWCAEAYLETDYSVLTQSDFKQTVKKYLMFQLVNETEYKAKEAVEDKGEENDE